MVIFVTGKRHCGKTAFIKKLAETLKKSGVAAAGILSPAEFVKGEKTRYYAQSVRTGEKKHLLDVSPRGPVIDKKGFAFANRVLARAQKAKTVIIDEFGPIELSERGFFNQARKLCRQRSKTVIITVRPGLIAASAQKLEITGYKIIDLDLKIPVSKHLVKLNKCL